jgi:hypothetical protein
MTHPYYFLQAHNINSCNNGSDWSERKFVRVIWRRGRGAGAEAAVIDASPGHSLILVSVYFVGGSVSG